MNLAKLFEVQRILVARIEKEHPMVEGEDRLSKIILALQVELGELANEWRGFKFWSNDQKARGQGNYLEYGCKCEGMGNRWVEKNPLLEEYVDCLHFILLIASDLKIHVPQTVSYEIAKPIPTETEVFIDLIQGVSWFCRQNKLNQHQIATGWVQYFATFNQLGETLGFTWEQIEQAYYTKNEINHLRQADGY